MIRTTGQLATIVAIRQDAAEQNSRNGHALPLSNLSPVVARNWQARVHMALRELGFTDRTQRQRKLDYLGELFGRQISSVNDLNWPEAQAFCSATYISLMRGDLERIADEYK